MSDSTIATRYANALLEEAVNARVAEHVDEDVDMIRATLEQSAELRRFFESPIVSRERKQNVIKALFEKRIRNETMKFIALLVEKRRESILPSVLSAYGRLRDVQLGTVEAHVRSAQPLADDQTSAIMSALREVTSKKVRLKVETDTTLLGGVVARIGDTVYDGSVRNKLDHLRDVFTASTGRAN